MLDSVGNTQNLSSSLASLTGGRTSSLGKQDFLMLLSTQLRNQDPLQPQDSSQFMGQLAQFSSLEQMQNMNETLGSGVLLQQSVNNSLATGLIGKTVEGVGDGFSLDDTGKATLGFRLGAGGDARVEVVDKNGKTVATLNSKGLKAGSNSIQWDGKQDDGSTAPAGEYTFKVTATDKSGNAIASDTSMSGRVTGVRFDRGMTYLLLGSREISLAEVTKISESSK